MNRLSHSRPRWMRLSLIGALVSATFAWTSPVWADDPTVPDAPTSVVATAANQSLVVEWQAPVNDGGSTILSYRATASDGTNTFYCDDLTVALTCTITGLSNLTTYGVTVTATNDVGTSDSSTSVNGTPDTLPSVPSISTVVPGDSSLTVTWSAPSNTGSSITSYTATLSAGGTEVTTCTTSLLTCTFSTLDNGTEYSVTLTATNSFGTTAASSPSTGTPRTVPGAPTLGDLTPGNASVLVNWSAPTETGGSAITGYTASATLSGSVVQSCTGGATATSCSISGLTNGTSYSITIVATNSAGDSSPSGSGSATPFTTPGAPTSVSASPGDTYLDVAWSAPASDGGDSISSYTASASDGSTTTTCEWTTGSLGCRIEGLDNGTTYSVSVVATNAAGNGSASSSVSATPYTVPGAPSIDTVDAGNGSLTVSWSAPADNGGAVISQYTATATHLSDVHTCQWSTGDLTCSITGLTNGTTYAVVVVATNAAGNSEASVSSDGTPFTVPGAPTITTVTPGDGTLTVSWTVPTTNGGSALTGFTATATNGSETATCTAADTETSCVIDTLTNGTTYSIVVVATNAAGDSVASTSVNAAPYTTPGTPDAPTLTAGNTSIQVDWTAPSDDGGASISGYTVTASDGTTSFTCHWTTGPLSCNITGLTNGTTYSVNVLAINAAGSSSTSDTTDATPLTVPDAPTITGVDRQLDTITVTWSAPLNNGGSAVTAYLVTATPSDSSGDVTCDTTGELTCDLTGVSNTASYSIVVVATNDAGDSAASAASLSSGYSAPAAPTLTAVTAGNAKLTLTFTAGSNGGQDVTDVAYSTDNGATWDTFGSTTGPFVITGLTNGHQYRVRVAQVNVIDQGAASNMMTATPATVPSAPRWLHGVRGNTTATLLWNAPASNGGSAVTGYLVSDRAGHTCAAAASSFTCTVSGLTNGTTYNFYVYAHNVMGDSVASNVNAVIPATTPGAPSIASAVASNKQVLLTVTDPASNGGAALGYYDYSTDNGVNWMSSYGHVSGHLITITGLTNGTTYQVRVRARNVVGAGASSVAVAATPRTIPSAPIIRSVVGVAHGFTVTFTTPSSSGGSPITTYQYSINNGTTWTTRPSGTTSTSFTVTGLVTGRYYQVQVRAVNAAGNSPASAPSRVLVR